MKRLRIVSGSRYTSQSPRAATRGLYRRSGAIWIVVFCAAVAVKAGWLPAAAAQDDPFPPVKVVLHPAAEPRPAMKYRLFPDVLDRIPGNAAVIYGKVKAEQTPFFSDKDLWDKILKQLEAPLAELRKDKGRGDPFTWGTISDRLDRAARCQYCDWQLPIGEPSQDFWTILLPEVQEMRSFARLLVVQVRHQIAQGRYDAAIKTFQTGYALSKHVGEGPTIVNGLVGVACSGIMSQQVQEFIQQPDAPNLYWALTNMPRPLIDTRPGFDVEMAAIYFSWPELRDLEHKDYPPQYWQQLMDKVTDGLYRFYEMEGSDKPTPPEVYRMATLAMIMRNYPEAKRYLIARGCSSAEVEAMPVPKAVLLYSTALFEEIRDETFKWYGVPFPESRSGSGRADQRLKECSLARREIIPLAGILLPALNAANTARARNERTFAVLRIFEALRIHGAGHNALPDKLGDVTEVPIPLDPVSGGPFVYQRSGNTARLEGPTPPGINPATLMPRRWDITFIPKGKQP